MRNLAIMATVLIALVGFAVLTKTAKYEPPSHQAIHKAKGSDDLTLSITACQAAQEKVKSALKAPSTAEFPSCTWSANEYEIRSDEERSRFMVSGHVDAQNSFGAKLRNNFAVILRRNKSKSEFGSDGWILEKISLE